MLLYLLMTFTSVSALVEILSGQDGSKKNHVCDPPQGMLYFRFTNFTKIINYLRFGSEIYIYS